MTCDDGVAGTIQTSEMSGAAESWPPIDHCTPARALASAVGCRRCVQHSATTASTASASGMLVHVCVWVGECVRARVSTCSCMCVCGWVDGWVSMHVLECLPVRACAFFYNPCICVPACLRECLSIV